VDAKRHPSVDSKEEAVLAHMVCLPPPLSSSLSTQAIILGFHEMTIGSGCLNQAFTDPILRLRAEKNKQRLAKRKYACQKKGWPCWNMADWHLMSMKLAERKHYGSNMLCNLCLAASWTLT
jgi:hypothetical protein